LLDESVNKPNLKSILQSRLMQLFRRLRRGF
jgi:hypothetical protein